MIEFLSFDRQPFGDDFPRTNTAQVEYLWRYLHELDAKSCIRETEYVDRHYLSDFSAYYSSAFRAPPPRCRRLHFFRLDTTEVQALFNDAYFGKKSKADVERLLEEAYLGFVVRRPLKDANIGRTVLKTYSEEAGERRFTATRRYHVHVGAIRLAIDGLAFQQQDVGAAVCASTSLWSALQKTARLAGNRTPTPNQITAASQSPFAASHGLDMNQMAMALSNLGYAADTFAPDHDPSNFRARLGACLQSHLPVILIVTGKDGSHTVTVTGYRAPRASAEMNPLGQGADEGNGISMRTGAISVLYVHDDNLGPHAHYELLDEPPQDLEDECYGYCHAAESQLWLLRGSRQRAPVEEWPIDCLLVEAAIVPKPSKLRMPVDDLMSAAWSFRHLVATIFEGTSVEYEVRFSSGVEYRQGLFSMNLDREQLRNFEINTTLPRHIAVISVHLRSEHLCDLIIDATSVDLCPSEESLLGIVAPGVHFGSQAWLNIDSICSEVNIRGVSAPPG